MIDAVYELLNDGRRTIKKGVYTDETNNCVVGLMQTTELVKCAFMGSKEQIIKNIVEIAVYSDDYATGNNAANELRECVNNAGYAQEIGITPRYDKEMCKYIIKFAISEN